MHKLCLKKWILMGMICVSIQIPALVSAITIGFQTSETSILTSDTAWIDLVVSDLVGEIVSAYDLDVTFDASIASITEVQFGSFLDLGVPGLSFQDADIVSTPGVVDIAELSLWDDTSLSINQPDSFVLASLHFEGLSTGTSLLGFSADPVFGIDVKGLNAEILTLTAEEGQLHVVPEPSTMILMGSGVLGLALYHLKRQRQINAKKSTG